MVLGADVLVAGRGRGAAQAVPRGAELADDGYLGSEAGIQAGADGAGKEAGADDFPPRRRRRLGVGVGEMVSKVRAGSGGGGCRGVTLARPETQA